jgi:catechol 2,3-dioxygenase-like lactoylglutathione lyase family enzyme
MSEKARFVGINHVALEVGDIDEALDFYGRLFDFELRGRIGNKMAFIDAGDQFIAIAILPGRGLDFLDPWGNRFQVVQYDEIQFTKTDAALRSLGAEGLGKTAKAEGEMREKGLL